jgi:hypothetical protein
VDLAGLSRQLVSRLSNEGKLASNETCSSKSIFVGVYWSDQMAET